MIKILNQYLLKLYLKYYFFSLLVLTFLFLLIDIFTILNRFQVSGSVYLGYFIYYIPWIISQMMPIAGVLATVFLFITIQKNNELVVFYSLGISIYQVLAPLLVVLFLTSFFGWFFTDKIVPKAIERRNYYYYVEMKKKPASYNKFKEKNIWLRTQEAIVNFKEVLSESEVTGAKVFFYDKDKWRLVRTIDAKNVRIGETAWVFKDGVETFYKPLSIVLKPFKAILTKPLQGSQEFTKSLPRPESMTLSQLSNAIKQAKTSFMETKLLETEYYGKLSFIFSALFLSLLALPFCIKDQRSSSLFLGLGFTLGLVLFYWVVYSLTLSLGKAGVLPAMVAAWLPGALSLTSFFILMRRERF